VNVFQGRFGAQAADYHAFRPLWPEEVFRRVLERVQAPRRLAVDLGAGTGLVAQRLLREFEQVVAVEPDERMLSQLSSAPGLRKVCARSEEADFDPGSVDLVTAGNAFHWMDGPAVLELVHLWLRPGGSLACFRYDPPHAAQGPLRELLDHEFHERWREHVHPRLRDPQYARRVLAGSPFARSVSFHSLDNDLELTLPQLLGFLRSTSYGGGYARSLEDPAGYWRELEARIRTAAGAGPFVLDFHVELLIATRS